MEEHGLRDYIQRELSHRDVDRQNKQMGRHVKFEIAVPESTRQRLRIPPDERLEA
jgi:hypothetical protein